MSTHRHPSLRLSTRLGLALATVLALGAGTAAALGLSADSAAADSAVADCAVLDGGGAPIDVLAANYRDVRDQAAGMAALERVVGNIETRCPQHAAAAESLRVLTNFYATGQVPFLPAAPAPAAPPVAAGTTATASPVSEDDEDGRNGAATTMSAVECEDLAASSSKANAELRSWLRGRGCDDLADELAASASRSESGDFVSGGSGGGDEIDSDGRDAAGMTPGDYALQACREQTGQTTAQCRAQSARGEAN